MIVVFCLPLICEPILKQNKTKKPKQKQTNKTLMQGLGNIINYDFSDLLVLSDLPT